MMDVTPINMKLQLIQSELKVEKTHYNEFGNYYFRNCEDILNAVKPLLAKQGLTLRLSDEIALVGERYYIQATATIQDNENNQISCTAYAREDFEKKKMDGSQLTGSASSYARKYALNGLFCIDDGVDSDKTNTHGKEEQLKEEPKEDEDLIFSILKSQTSLSELSKYYGENKSKVTNRAEFNKVYSETAKQLKAKLNNANN